MNRVEFCRRQAQRCREIAGIAEDQPDIAEALRRLANDLVAKAEEERPAEMNELVSQKSAGR